MNHAALAEALTGRQRWGSYESCSEDGPTACRTCPVQQRRLARLGDLPWPPDVPVLLARTTPRTPTPGMLFADPAHGRSTVELFGWRDSRPIATTGWEEILNSPSMHISWRWIHAGREAFWIVRDRPTADVVSVDEQHGAATRHELRSRHSSSRLAVMTCHGACAHNTGHLEQFAADLAVHAAPSTEPDEFPESLPGVPLLRFSNEGTRTVLNRERSRDYPASTVHITWDVPGGDSAAAALVAHAVRLTCLCI
ncbi:hypothetical protein U5640_12270 [Streptomyces sp. SS7]|uniref:hypothetical protein n=1 Tax=Streptomyces sp. SS7 TaxID=3108485 RepID=UPI0030EB59B9